MTQRGQSRGQQHQLIAEQQYQVVGTAQTWGIEIKMTSQTFQCADLTEQLHLPTLEIGFAFFRTKHLGSVAGRQFDDLIDFGEIALGDGLRPCREQTDHADTGHRQQSFGDTGNR